MMTIEEKAKAYDNALERAKTYYDVDEDNTMQIRARGVMEYLFPVLVESEDEKAINAIKKLVYWADSNQQVTSEQYNLIMTWLKKQGEQKLTEGTFVSVKTAIQAWRKMRFEVYAQASGNRHEPNYSDSNTKMFSLNDIDEIFEKISDSVVEQEPVEHHVSEYTDKYIKSSLITMIHGWKNGASHWCSDPKFCDAATNFLKNQEPVDIEAIKAEYYEAGFQDGKKYCADHENGQEYDGGKEYSQEPAAWSEEDEKMLNNIINLIHGGAHYAYEKEIEWLKGIKDRCIPQPKQEWSEENEQNLVKIPKFKVGDTIEFNGLGHNKYTIKEVCGTTHYINIDNARMDMSYTDANFELVEHKSAERSEDDEKQGEKKQMATQELKPKFKVGDWIISDEAHEDYRICKIIEVGNGNYKIESVHGYKGYNEYEVFDSIYRLWTIDDAKPGDVLVDYHPFILKKVDTSGRCYAYCGLNLCDEFMIESEGESGEWTWNSNVHPATNEETNLLFQKMEKAGYEWDAEKLELRKIEQKPIEVVEPKFKIGDWVVDKMGNINCVKEVDTLDNTTYGYTLYNDTYFSGSWADDWHLWSIEDAKPGDILAVEPYFDTDKYPFPFVAIYESRGLDFFNSYCFNSFDGIFYDQGIGHDLNKIHPATKVQREFLFAQMKDAGYEWDDEKLELTKIDQEKERVLYTPKFKEGDWIVYNNGRKCANSLMKIVKLGLTDYLCRSQSGQMTYWCESIDKTYHLWTIEDAIPGDILTDKEGCTCIFRDLDTDFDGTMVTAYCGINVDGYFVISEEGEVWTNPEEVYPADSDDRNNLFAKMKDAGYEWDAEKLELKKTDHAEEDGPKFKVGDWVVNNNGEPQFSQVIARSWPDSKIKRAENNLEIFINTATLDKQYHLWTIQDAKPGDVLAAYECYVIFKEIDGLNIRCYCTYHFMNNPMFFVNTLQNKDAFKPSTKEQRDLLFQKMHEAGYEWDSTKLELNTVNEKPKKEEPIDWNSEKLSRAKKDAYNEALDKNEYNSNNPTFDDGWDAAIKYMRQQIKPVEWSEDDENEFNHILKILEEVSKEQEESKGYNNLIRSISWLKSRRFQKQWKPTKEQIIALRWILNNIPYNTHKEEISGLLEQILKF